MYKIYTYETFIENFSNIKNIDKEFLELKQGIYFCVKNEKNLIGYAIVEKKENNYILKRIFIKKEYRYKSYGTKLLKLITNTGCEKYISKILCEDISCEKFLKKYGFKNLGKKLEFDNIQPEIERSNLGKKVIKFSMAMNIILAILKICGGIYGRSRALVSDGINSLADLGSAVAIYLGIYFSSKPADEEHPYGHEKIESIIGNMMGLFLLITAFELIKGNIYLLYIGEYTTTPSYLTIVWAGLSIIINFFMYKYKLKIGIKTDNSALIADAKDSKSDVFSSTGVILGILLSLYVSPIFDVIISLLVGILIFKEGVSIILETSNIILDKQDREFINTVEKYIEDNTQVKNVHDVYMRKSGNKIFLTLHIRVNKNMTVYEAHTLADEIKKSLILDFENVKDVIIHIDYLID